MAAILIVIAMLAGLAGVGIFSMASTVMHEIEAILCFVVAAVTGTGGFIVNAIELQTRRMVDMADRQTKKYWVNGVRRSTGKEIQPLTIAADSEAEACEIAARSGVLVSSAELVADVPKVREERASMANLIGRAVGKAIGR